MAGGPRRLETRIYRVRFVRRPTLVGVSARTENATPSDPHADTAIGDWVEQTNQWHSCAHTDAGGSGQLNRLEYTCFRGFSKLSQIR